MLVYQRVTKTKNFYTKFEFSEWELLRLSGPRPGLAGRHSIWPMASSPKLAVMRIDRGIGRLSPVESEGCAQSVQPPGDIPPCLVSRLAGVLPTLPWGHWELHAELEANPSVKFALPTQSLVRVPGAKQSGTGPFLCQFVCRAVALSGLDSCPAWSEGSWLPEKALATILVVGQRKGRTLWWKHPRVSNETWPTLKHIKTRLENLKSVHKEDYWNKELLLVSRIPGFGAGRHSIWPVSESLWKGPEPPIDCKAG